MVKNMEIFIGVALGALVVGSILLGILRSNSTGGKVDVLEEGTDL